MKKCLTLLLAVVLLLTALPAGLAEEASEFSFSLQADGSYWISAYTGNDDVLTLPVEKDGVPVTGIAAEAFARCGARVIEAGEPLEYVGPYAFLSCPNLQDLRLPATLRVLDTGAFADCRALAALALPEGLVSIGANAFTACSGLESVSVPASVEFIDKTAFAFCPSLTLAAVPGSYAQSYAEANGIAWTEAAAQSPAPAADVGKVGAPFIEMSDFVSARNFVRFVEGDFTLAWRAEGSVAAYMVYIYDEDDNIYVERQTTETTLKVSSRILLPGVVYTARIGAIPTGGSEADAAWSELSFALAETPVEEPVEKPDWQPVVDETQYDYTYIDGRLWITGYTGPGGDVVMPSVLDGAPVFGLEDGTFADRTDLVSVVLPDTLEEIGWDADVFYDHYDSESSSGAFRRCTGLRTVVFPASLRKIGWGAFWGCTALQEALLPDGLEYLGPAAFRGCSSLTELVVPDSVTGIDGSFVRDCTSLLTSNIPEGVRWNSYCAFSGCTSLQRVVLPASVTEMRSDAFSNCPNVVLAAPAGSYAERYANEHGLKFEAIGTAIQDVDETQYDYKYIDGRLWITNYTGPGGDVVMPSVLDGAPVFGLEDGTFADRTDLVSVVLPDTLEEIGWDADVFYDHYDSESYSGAFRRCTGLRTVVFPASLRKIGWGAFWGCTALQEALLPDGLKYLGPAAFRGCESLTELVVPDSVTRIDGSFVRDCTSLLTSNIPEGVRWNSFCAFSGCTSLQRVVLPASVTEMLPDTFSNCPNVVLAAPAGSYAERYANEHGLKFEAIGTAIQDVDETQYDYTYIDGRLWITNYTGPGGDVVMPSVLDGAPVFGLEDGTFADRTDLVSVVLPDTLEEIGWDADVFYDHYDSESYSGAFRRCTGLRTVVFPASLRKIGWGAFWGCTGLQEALLPDGLEYLGPAAFRDCSSLTELVVPDSVTRIDGSFVRDCTSLLTSNIPEGVRWNSYCAFSGCTSLQRVVLPASVTEMLSDAFANCPNVVLAAPAGSYAERYANEHGLKFEAIGTAPQGGGPEMIGLDLTPESDFAYETRADGTLWISAYTGSDAAVAIPPTLGGTPVYGIADGAFVNNSRLEYVLIPGTVVKIGITYEEYQDNNLSEDDLGVFRDCPNLETVLIPDSVELIGYRCFRNCSSLVNITIPDSVTYVAPGVFRNCASLVELKIPDSVSDIHGSMFVNCTSLERVALPDGAEWNSYCAFSGCQSLVSVNIPSTTTRLRENAFKDCASLETLTIPASVTEIDSSAFSGCSRLTLRVWAGSYAETFAQDNGLSYEIIQ